jgi:hypothetical protein
MTSGRGFHSRDAPRDVGHFSSAPEAAGDLDTSQDLDAKLELY